MSDSLYESVWDTQVAALVSLFASVSVGETVSYQRMSGAAGVEITSQHPALRRALREALRAGIVMLNHAAIGYERLSDRGTVVESRRGVRKVYRASRRVIAALRTVDTQALTQSEAATYYARMAALRAASKATHGKTMPKPRLAHSTAIADAIRAVRNGADQRS